MNRFSRFTPYTSKGLSLVELMISIALVAIILAGVVKLYADSHRSSLANEGVARTQEGIRYAIDHISRSASRAGYMGCVDFFTDADSGGQNLEVLVTADAGVNGRFNFNNPVSGTDSGDDAVADTLTLRAAQSSTGLIVNGEMTSESDVIRVDATQLGNSTIEAGDVLVISDCNRASVFMATSVGGGQIGHDTTAIDSQSNSRANFSYVFGREGRSIPTVYSAGDTAINYTIGDSTAGACAADSPQFCALLANGDELLQGVENMQVLYGERNIAGAIQYRSADAVIDWRSVVSLELTLTLNSVDRSFSTGADAGVGGLIRKEVSQIIAIRNNNL
ncbi:PilW family protein [Porticoccus sp. W117]|uniref:PilW family protein n=1 Tax=Porticoccus sp. W117 TaxID=3054777 RepID=UPI002593A0F4|nr:PilW family protein [Porticoccus sp. W117]MDM3871260.1 PilW family protein [Porticoccus sp. W117]